MLNIASMFLLTVVCFHKNIERLLLSVLYSVNTLVVKKIHHDINGVSFLFHSPRLKMCFGIRLLNLELFVLDALIRHPTNLYFW